MVNRKGNKTIGWLQTVKKRFQHEGLTLSRSLNSIFDSYKHKGHVIDILKMISSKFEVIGMQNDKVRVITKFSLFENRPIFGVLYSSLCRNAVAAKMGLMSGIL